MIQLIRCEVIDNWYTLDDVRRASVEGSAEDWHTILSALRMGLDRCTSGRRAAFIRRDLPHARPGIDFYSPRNSDGEVEAELSFADIPAFLLQAQAVLDGTGEPLPPREVPPVPEALLVKMRQLVELAFEVRQETLAYRDTHREWFCIDGLADQAEKVFDRTVSFVCRAGVQPEEVNFVTHQ
jgi:hypothetical protein